jgi:hypothetical protein
METIRIEYDTSPSDCREFVIKILEDMGAKYNVSGNGEGIEIQYEPKMARINEAYRLNCTATTSYP